MGIHLGADARSGERYFSDTDQWHQELEDDFGGTYCETIYCSPDPDVSISGPDELPPDLLCQWYASGSGGVPPYSYQWFGVASGTGSSIETTLSSSGYLNVTITDDVGHDNTASLYVTIDENAPEPPECEA